MKKEPGGKKYDFSPALFEILLKTRHLISSNITSFFLQKNMLQ